jgi:hypothetical protein
MTVSKYECFKTWLWWFNVEKTKVKRNYTYQKTATGKVLIVENN